MFFDWNHAGAATESGLVRPIAVVDETLREGLQSPSATDPPIAEKLSLLHQMAQVGIDVATLGMPGSSQRAFDDALSLCREVARANLRLVPALAARTLARDLEPIVDIVQKAGVAVRAFVFTGSSPIRQSIEGWSLDFLRTRSQEAIEFAVRGGVDVCFVTEDTTRSDPATLRALLLGAIDAGASGICLADTAGHAVPKGVHALVRFVQSLLAERSERITIDWHGHNDRGLALANTIAAIDAGVDRVHGTVLGIGERVGNAPIEQILLHLALSDIRPSPARDLGGLIEYVRACAGALQVAIPAHAPLVGSDAFRTGSGVHAAAISKAIGRGDLTMGDSVYSAVSARMFGTGQEIVIGPMSGGANVVYWLESRDLQVTRERVDAILAEAKLSRRVLTEAQLHAVMAKVDAVEAQGGEAPPR